MKRTTDGQRIYNVQDLEARFPKRIADRIWGEVEVGIPTSAKVIGNRVVDDNSGIPLSWGDACDEADFEDLCDRCCKAIAEEAQQH